VTNGIDRECKLPDFKNKYLNKFVIFYELQKMSAWVGRLSQSVCLSVCLFVRSITQESSQSEFKRGAWNDLGIS